LLAQLQIAALCVAGSYLCGSVPWALLMARWVRGIDIRTVGSGNVGATNAYRALGPWWGSVVLFLDFTKGTVPMLVALWATRGQPLMDLILVLVALAAMLGHTYSPWIGFRGGKGFATGAGAVTVLTPWSVIVLLPIFLVIAVWTRWISLGSIVSATLYPFVTLGFLYVAPLPWQGPVTALFAVVAGALVVWRHRVNIRRIIDGTEARATWGLRRPDIPASRVPGEHIHEGGEDR
jgi:acyl phosphate:glycerol-3-phosphate acyltransferase